MSFVHRIDDIRSVLSPLIIAISIISWIVGMIAQIKRLRTKDPGKKATATKVFIAAILVFGGIIGLDFFVCGIVNSEGQTEVNAMLQNEILSVQVNGKSPSNPTQLVADIRHIDASALRYHHSHPTGSITVLLQTKHGDLKLNLARDSDRPEEYWVFYPQYKITSLNDVGKVSTEMLDSY